MRVQIHNHPHRELAVPRRLAREILEVHLYCRHKVHLAWAGEQTEWSRYRVPPAGLRADGRQ